MRRLTDLPLILLTLLCLFGWGWFWYGIGEQPPELWHDAQRQSYLLTSERDPDAIRKAWEKGEFSPIKDPYARYATVGQTLWVRFTLDNPESMPRAIVIEHDDLYTDTALLYQEREDGSFDLHQVGESVPAKKKELDSHEPAFLLTLPARQTSVFYLEVDVLTYTGPRLILWKEAAEYFNQRQMRIARNLFYFGLATGLIFYNLFVYLKIRREEFAHYILYAGFFVLAQIFHQNLHQYFFDIFSPYNNLTAAGTYSLACFFLLHFAKGFLGIDRTRPKFNFFIRVMSVVALVLTLNCVITALIVYSIDLSAMMEMRVVEGALDTINVFIFVVHVGLLAKGIVIWYQGVTQARFYVLAFSCLLVMGIAPILAEYMGVQIYSTYFQMLQLGSSLELLLFAFALADKISQLQQEKNEASAKAVEEAHLRSGAEALSRRMQEQNDQLTAQATRLKQLYEEKNLLLGMFAHDLINPLSGIQNILDILGEDESQRELSQEERRSLLRNALASAEHTSQIVTELVKSASLDSGARTLNPVLQDISIIIARVVHLNENNAQRKKISIVTEIPEVLKARVDTQAFQEILDNLLSNAIKYSPPEKTVWISARATTDRRIHISIRDEGPGFSNKDKEHIYGAFTKLSAKPTAGEHSSGLGLSIVKRLVELHGATIVLESERGRGAAFHLRFPAPNLAQDDA